ncbi:MAG: class II fructose-bisphosphate aldolase [Erysipelotrichaceae bacterium]|nr:class II fructose-bisphosphate aldolase [Erysipelotrichaceae bacterium]
MLVTAKELLQEAEERKTAIGAFNVTGMATMCAILEAAEELNEPVIIDFAPVHEEMGIISLDRIGPAMVALAKAAKVKVCCHLDHGVELDYIRKALELGFTSCMYDGSALPFEENVANTRRAVEMARAYGATVEAELGKMAGLTLNNDHVVENRDIDRANFTNPAQAREFVEATGVDMLACSFGTSHGLYVKAPKLDSELVRELRETSGVPIVMHGGSGVMAEEIHTCVNNGVRKINYYTYMAKAGGEAVRDSIPAEGSVYYHDLQVIGRKAMKENVRQAILLFTNRED